MSAILQLTDGTPYPGTINLFQSYGRWSVVRWVQTIAAPKGGGVFADSPMKDGRRPVFRRWGNAIEVFEFRGKACTVDAAIESIQDLLRLLEQGVNFFTSTPEEGYVWLQNKEAWESNQRYAQMVWYSIPELGIPYGDNAFVQPDHSAAIDRFTLQIERRHWQDVPPGDSTCVQISGEQEYEQTQVTRTSSPAAQADDGYICLNFKIIDLAWRLQLGYSNTRADWVESGIRFPNVQVPQGADILDAWITFEAAATDNADDCIVNIMGELTPNAAQFTTYQNWIQRARTNARVHWGSASKGIQHWTAGNSYDTPPITPVVQEIVNQATWASGNALVIFLQDAGSDNAAQRQPDSFDTAPTAPVLHIVYATGGTDFGRDATCLDEVFIANKHNRAQLSHIWIDDAVGGFGPNLITGYPYDLLPNPVKNGDIIYFGSDTALVDSGPFCSLVFDILPAAAYTGAATITWQYWNGGWANLTVRDNTDNGTGAFSNTGVNSVHWEQPSDWQANAINFITAYWVRAIVTIGGGDAITTPTQVSRDVYTILWPYVDIAANQVGGDIEMLSRVRVHNHSDQQADGDPVLYATRVLCGLRSLSRGADFTPFLNLAEEQNPAGITVIDGTATAFVVEPEAPAGEAVEGVIPAADTVVAEVHFDQALASQYKGTFHAFLRAYQTGSAAGDLQVFLRGYISYLAVYESRRVVFDQLATLHLLDLGRVTLPFFQTPYASDGIYQDAVFFYVMAYGDATTQITAYDLILFPVDEWAVDVASPALVESYSVGRPDFGDAGRVLDIDSVQVKEDILTVVRRSEDDLITALYQAITPAAAILQREGAQRYWFLSANVPSGVFVQSFSKPEIAHSVQVFGVNRYLTFRGSR